MKKIVAGLVVVALLWLAYSIDASNPKNSSSSEHVDGWLIKQATWAEDFDDVFHMSKLAQTGRVHGTDKPVKVEIWDLNDRSVVMIYFLEGKYAGCWGYTTKGYTTTTKP